MAAGGVGVACGSWGCRSGWCDPPRCRAGRSPAGRFRSTISRRRSVGMVVGHGLWPTRRRGSTTRGPEVHHTSGSWSSLSLRRRASSWAADSSGRCRWSTTSWPASASTRRWRPMCRPTTADYASPRARALGVVVRNLIVDHEPVYAMGEWAAPLRPGGAGPRARRGRAAQRRPRRRALDRLFDADRAALLTRVVLGAVASFGIDCYRAAQRLDHRSPCTATTAARTAPSPGRQADPGDHLRPQQGPPARPQAAGVDPHRHRRRRGPVAHRVAVGQHHRRPHPRRHLGRAARSGRARRTSSTSPTASCAPDQPMDHIDSAGGRFVTVLPRTRREDALVPRLGHHAPPAAWTEALAVPGPPPATPDRGLATFESPLALQRRLPDHLGALQRQGGPRRRIARRPPPDDAARDLRRARRPPRRPQSPDQDPRRAPRTPPPRHPRRHQHRRVLRHPRHRHPRRRYTARTIAAGPAPNTRYRQHPHHPAPAHLRHSAPRPCAATPPPTAASR